MTRVLSLVNEPEVCLFGRFLSNSIKFVDRFVSYAIDIFVCEMKDSILYITMSTKGEHAIKQSAAFSSPVSTLYASAPGSMTHL